MKKPRPKTAHGEARSLYTIKPDLLADIEKIADADGARSTITGLAPQTWGIMQTTGVRKTTARRAVRSFFDCLQRAHDRHEVPRNVSANAARTLYTKYQADIVELRADDFVEAVTPPAGRLDEGTVDVEA